VFPFCLLAVVLAGCATGPQRSGEPLTGWESPGQAVPPAPPPAPVRPTPAPTVSPAPAPATKPATTNRVSDPWISLGRWCKANGLAAPCPLSAGVAPRYALATTNGVFTVQAGSEAGQWDGLEIRLAFAPQMLDGQPYLHALDLNKTVQPLVSGASLSFQRTNRTVVIDPGHGGADSGARSAGGYRYEKEFTLDWARRLAPLLAAKGWRVFLTRTNDTDLSPSKRVTFAEAHQAGVFVSLHFNSSTPSGQQAGLETYCLTPKGMPSTVTRGYGDDPALAFPNNAFDTENLQFALRVHRALLQVNGRRDRGVRRARFLGVLRGQQCPAILVEGGYLSNPQEARRIADPAYRQKLAEAVAEALPERIQVGARMPGVVTPKSDIRAQRPAVSPPNALVP
jgi:N-acetylmuramoyl-L-alanine amidase